MHVAIQAARCGRAPMTTGSLAASRKLQSSLLSDGPLPMYRHCARGCVSAGKRAGSRADAPPGRRDGPSAEPTHPSPGRAAPAQGRRPPKPEAARGAPERCRRGPPRGRQQKRTGRKGTLQPLRTRGRRWRGEAERVSLYSSQGSLRYKARAAPKARRKKAMHRTHRRARVHRLSAARATPEPRAWQKTAAAWCWRAGRRRAARQRCCDAPLPACSRNQPWQRVRLVGPAAAWLRRVNCGAQSTA